MAPRTLVRALGALATLSLLAPLVLLGAGCVAAPRPSTAHPASAEAPATALPAVAASITREDDVATAAPPSHAHHHSHGAMPAAPEAPR